MTAAELWSRLALTNLVVAAAEAVGQLHVADLHEYPPLGMFDTMNEASVSTCQGLFHYIEGIGAFRLGLAGCGLVTSTSARDDDAVRPVITIIAKAVFH